MPRWLLKPKYPSDFAEKFPGYGSEILQLLYDRGLDTQEKIDEFLKPDFSQDIHDPFLFKDMVKAVERINLAIENQEKILIYGDYDADGVTATVLLEKTLRKLGAKKVDIYIPHRETDGYGVSEKNAEKIIADKVNLVITVDCGITNIEPIKKIRQAGIGVVITDHHLAGENLPEADAILNCSLDSETYPFKKLAGVGVAYKLAQALFLSPPFQGGVARQTQCSRDGVVNNGFSAFEKWLLDLVAIGTIGDVSPILGENRTLVSYGLKVLNKTPRKGLQELIRVSSLSNGEELKDLPLGSDLYDLDVRNVSFQIVPRINAAGRMDHASLAYNLLTTENEVEAIALARDIQQKNTERQKVADQMLSEAKEIFGQVNDSQKILIATKAGWGVGLVGLVAGKLKDEYNRPIILFSHDGHKYIGSGRSIPEFNITENLGKCAEFLVRFGGHSQACGLEINCEENYQNFTRRIIVLAEEKLKNVELAPTLEIDTEIVLKDLDWELFDELEKFEPFAEANPMPLFLVKNLKVVEIMTIGKDAKHLRFQLKQGNLVRKAISFGTAEKWGSQIKAGDIIDAVVEFGVNEWNGNRELQLKIIDVSVGLSSQKL